MPRLQILSMTFHVASMSLDLQSVPTKKWGSMEKMGKYGKIKRFEP